MYGPAAHAAAFAAQAVNQLPVECPGFEGVEKRLELSFVTSASNRAGAWT